MTTAADFRECMACSCFAARRTARVITQHYDRHLKPSGLRGTQFTVLVMLVLGGPRALSQLADQLAVERTTLTRNLRLLLSRRLVKESSAPDRRVRVLEVTKQGVAAARAALPRWREAQKSIARRLGADAIDALATVSLAATESNPGRA